MDIDSLAIVLLCICVIMLVYALFMMRRNEQVFRERMKVHGKIFEKDNNGKYIWSRQIGLLTAEVDGIATYSQMMHRFWIKPSSFYADFIGYLENEKNFLEHLKRERRRKYDLWRRSNQG